ncbi:Surfeit locus protein 6 [Sciurus carolinensis]|uniref:Surfeit locus protein 6 n=1 Tax=Sciurus carolinensis TaxID=30640 RepID=A0AA41SUJ2_SCICA|nr:Surfeit locus protein 6 [Sciurus carolinensis]
MVTLQNCLQVLECQQSQQGPLEELHKEHDTGQVHDLETKMKWTTWLSKMYCVMMCSNACLQLETLKHKEKPWVQPHQWEKCSATWWRMQQTQYKQHQNLHKVKVAEVE